MNMRLIRPFLSVVMALFAAGSALAQESTGTETSIGFGPMIAVLGLGVLAILLIGLVMSSRESSDETGND